MGMQFNNKENHQKVIKVVGKLLESKSENLASYQIFVIFIKFFPTI